jgi:hypothetical protein
VAALVLALAWPGGASAGKPKTPPPPIELPAVHANPANTIRFRTPADWLVATKLGEPELTEARGGRLMLRILRRPTETGLDSLHVDCMMERLAGRMETGPQVDYEYDFVGGEIGARRLLDSAFVVHYDEPILGTRDWRQRNLTLVGGGESICVVAYAPAAEWKKAKELRRLLEAVLATLEVQPWQ